ncbi:MAG: S24/S26 family peptidase [Oscillospiraceae bacterium]|nr:S24/S26 family peptidase [Oscillospiraceae bacterium]
MTTFEQELEQNGRLVFTNVGTSMEPLIRQGRDLLIIEKPHGRLKKYDIPLYRRQSGQYVLHRILKVRAQDYVLCGDNRRRKETGITDRQIIGVLTAVVRDGKEIPMTALRCRMYAHLWCDLFPLRAFILTAKSVPKRLKRKYGK